VKAARIHDRIIAEAAERELAPLGFERKGRSRLWFADRGYWVSVVEFQPSQWSKGSYLNRGPHWLWGLGDGLSFDRPVAGERSFIAFDTPEAFTALAAEQARAAARTSAELDATFSSIKQTADVLRRDLERGRPGGWPGFHAAVASGLSGDTDSARQLLEETIDSSTTWRPDFLEALGELLRATRDPDRFRGLIVQRVSFQRARLGLAEGPDGRGILPLS
jgi:hypothetical protein